MNRTDPLDLVTTGVAVGGAGIARDGDGRVVFVEGALVGERVSVEIVETKKSFRRGRVLDVLEPAPGRVLPSCPEIANGCGGCDLAHASHAAQREMKAAMVADSLRRLGRLADLPDIDPGPDLATTGFRTTIRAAVVDGRAGLRHRRSHDVVTVASCEVAHPVVEGMLVNGRYGDADEVTIRVGANTGEQAVFVGGSEPDEGTVIHEEIAGRRFRISPRSFFQTRADGAAALVSVVDEAIGPDPTGTLVDLCSGVGLFAATIGDRFDRVVTVESNRSSVADARVNLAHLGDRVAVRSSTFERWTPEPADVVIADPSRAGLGKEGAANVAATGAPLVVLISCDAGSLGRDAGLLTAAGYRLDTITLVDLFPNTAHVEVVTTYRRSPP